MLISYYEGLQELVEDYIEDIEICANRDVLMKKGNESLSSGVSLLTI